MNLRAVWAIYSFEMARTGRTLLQSILSPVISTCLYFVVFGAAIGSRITEIEGIDYGAFIVPGLIMLMLLTQSTANASFGIYFPKFVGTIYELLSAPVSYIEIVLGYVGAAATKSIILGLLILGTAALLVPLRIAHPVWMLAFLVLTAVSFSLFGFILGIWADGFEKLQVVPLLIITPLTFLGGTLLLHRRIAAALADGRAVQSCRLPDQRLPLELLRERRRGRRYQPGHDDAFLVICLATVWWIFKTGYGSSDKCSRKVHTFSGVCMLVVHDDASRLCNRHARAMMRGLNHGTITWVMR